MRSLLTAALLFLALPAFSQQRPAITGIAFMRLYTTNYEAAEDFYSKTLAYRPAKGPEALLRGNAVYPVNHLQWIELVPHAGPVQDCMMAAVGFTTRDAAGLQRYLQAHDIKIEEPLRAGEFSVRDPEGNLVVFVQSSAVPSAAADSLPTLVSHAAETPEAPSHRIIHVGFIVHDHAKEDAFWRELLGFRPYWHGTMHPGHEDFVSLQVPNGSDWIEYMLIAPEKPTKRDYGLSDHFSLGVDHMQTVLADLQRNGCEGKNCTAIQAGVDGKVQLNLYDPDQTRIEFMEFKPVMKPCCSEFTGTHPTAIEEH